MLPCHFFLTLIAAMCGGPFLYGYNMGVVNTPSPLIREFYTKVYATRAGLYPFPTASANESASFDATFKTELASNLSTSNQPDANLSTSPVKLSKTIDEKQRLKELEKQLGIELLWTMTIAICLIGGMLGAFASGRMADKLGRKPALLINQAFSILGAFLFGIVKVTKLPELMLVARFLVGVASGVGLGLAPLYLSELATASIRGPATSACHLAVTFGILMSQLLGLAGLLGTEDGWPFLLALVGIPSCITLAVLPFCPETPRYMMTSRGASCDQVLSVYKWLYGDVAGETEASNLCKELALRGVSSPQKRPDAAVNTSNIEAGPVEMRTPVEAAGSPTSTNSKVFFRTPANGGEEHEVVPLTDMNAGGQSATQVDSGLQDPAKATSAVDSGKRPNLARRESLSQRAVTLGRLFCSEEFRLPIFLSLWLHVTQQWSGINAVMSYSGNIFASIMPADVVQYAVLSTGVASCLSTAVMMPFMSRLGRRPVVLVSCAVMTAAHLLLTLCSALSSKVPELNFLAIVFVIIYICGYAGTGCTPAILVSEMFLQNARAVAMSLAIATRWGSAFILLLAFPYMSNVLGVYVFLVFAFICLLSLVLFCVWLHETRGKPALQIHDQLAHGFEHVQFHMHMPHVHMPHMHMPHVHIPHVHMPHLPHLHLHGHGHGHERNGKDDEKDKNEHQRVPAEAHPPDVNQSDRQNASDGNGVAS